MSLGAQQRRGYLGVAEPLISLEPMVGWATAGMLVVGGGKAAVVPK